MWVCGVWEYLCVVCVTCVDKNSCLCVKMCVRVVCAHYKPRGRSDDSG